MSVDPASAKHSADHAGARYFFCSARCREKFEATPARYLEPGEPEPAPAGAEDAIYTCPMHPEVRQKGPGSCPICGMALEPEMVTRDEGPSEEYLDMRRRFIVGALLSVPIVIIAMGRHLLPGFFHGFSAGALGVAELILATPVVLWRAGRSSSAAGSRSGVVTSTCSPSSQSGPARPTPTARWRLSRPGSSRAPSGEPTVRSGSISKRRR